MLNDVDDDDDNYSRQLTQLWEFLLLYRYFVPVGSWLSS